MSKIIDLTTTLDDTPIDTAEPVVIDLVEEDDDNDILFPAAADIKKEEEAKDTPPPTAAAAATEIKEEAKEEQEDDEYEELPPSNPDPWRKRPRDDEIIDPEESPTKKTRREVICNSAWYMQLKKELLEIVGPSTDDSRPFTVQVVRCDEDYTTRHALYRFPWVTMARRWYEFVAKMMEASDMAADLLCDYNILDASMKISLQAFVHDFVANQESGLNNSLYSIKPGCLGDCGETAEAFTMKYLNDNHGKANEDGSFYWRICTIVYWTLVLAGVLHHPEKINYPNMHFEKNIMHETSSFYVGWAAIRNVKADITVSVRDFW